MSVCIYLYEHMLKHGIILWKLLLFQCYNENLFYIFLTIIFILFKHIDIQWIRLDQTSLVP